METARAALDNGRHAVAAGRLEAAIRLAPEDGPTWFLMGRAYEGLERWEAARKAYLHAVKFDHNPSRATEGINGTIREVAARENAILVDVEETFTQLSPHGLVGFNLIEDYVHPTREGHEQIAFALWQALRDIDLPAAAGEVDPRGVFAEVVQARRSRDIASENTATYLYNQGLILANQERWDETRAKLERSVELAPWWTDARASVSAARC